MSVRRRRPMPTVSVYAMMVFTVSRIGVRLAQCLRAELNRTASLSSVRSASLSGGHCRAVTAVTSPPGLDASTYLFSPSPTLESRKWTPSATLTFNCQSAARAVTTFEATEAASSVVFRIVASVKTLTSTSRILHFTATIVLP